MFDTPAKAIVHILLFLSVGMATITYKKYKKTTSKYFLWFLWLTLIVELLGSVNYYYYKNQSVGLMPHIMNLISEGYLLEKYIVKITWLYNLFRIVTFSFYIYYYYLLTKNIKKKKQIQYLLVLCILVSIIDLIINKNIFISENLMITRIVGGLFILIASTIYLVEVLKSNEILTFHKTLPFWVTFGALIFYLTTIPVFLFKEYLKEFNYNTYTTILYTSNYFLYGSFIIGFIINAIEYNKKEKLKINEK